MTHGSLFSGIGGFDLAAQWMGWSNKFHCEWNPFGQRVLKYYWPEAESFTDITKTDFTKYANSIDIISGGFPCQPYSAAGKRLGKDDDRHLWPEMLRAIKEIRPRWVVGENVRGLTNWNGGVVFDEVQSDLELAGYEVTPFLLPAVAVDAPHRRDRIWFVAHSESVPRNDDPRNEKHETQKIQSKRSNEFVDVTNTNSQRLEGVCFERCDGKEGWQNKRRQHSQFTRNDWRGWPSQPPVCNGNDGLSYKLDGITFSKWSQESIKAGGNAIVPQVVFQIFKAVEQYETLLQ